jgi:hypothetical protein
MAYQSIDQIQKLLSDTVFAYKESSKKAAGRALGTIVEIIGFYLLKAWGHEYNLAIERPLPEYANTEIKHNVEFTFHKSKQIRRISLPKADSITSTKLYNAAGFSDEFLKVSSRNLLKNGIVKNACTIATTDHSFCNAYFFKNISNILVYELDNKPYAMFECKRVGVEEGMKTGPQTIEKAKQGSYVARTVSSIQRVRLQDGRIGGAIECDGKFSFYKDYYELIEDAIISNRVELLSNFILTVGIVSNHGNWFTSENQNKEMKVLAQSYDWLLFLTDEGLASFIQEVMGNSSAFRSVKTAFEKSYEHGKKENRFTKTKMDIRADKVLTKYFTDNIKHIESWFNVISPRDRKIELLNTMLTTLKGEV